MTERNPGIGIPTNNSSTHPSFSESTVKHGDGQSHATRRRILIVDDNADAADSLHALLMLSGHETCVAYSGAIALDAFRSRPFDFALIDICMPDMNGYDLVRHMRVAGRALPVMVAVTGLADNTSKRGKPVLGITWSSHTRSTPCRRFSISLAAPNQRSVGCRFDRSRVQNLHRHPAGLLIKRCFARLAILAPYNT